MTERPRRGDRARYSGEAGTFVGRITETEVGSGIVRVSWSDGSSTRVRSVGLVRARDVETEWEIVR